MTNAQQDKKAIIKLYKLTDSNGITHGMVQWGDGVEHQVVEKVKKPLLCTRDVIHAYKNINLAFLLNPIHASYEDPILWEAEGEIVAEDFGKVGCYELKTIQKLATPSWALNGNSKSVQVAFAVLCAESVLHIFEKQFPKDDRVKKAIEAAKNYLKSPAVHAAYAARAAAYAARAATYAAAYAAAYAAEAARAAARAAADAAYAAAAAAYAAAYAAEAAAALIDFGALADKAVMQYGGSK